MSHERTRRWAVTGAGGFIGSAVVRALVEEAQVSALLGAPGAKVAAPPPGVQAAFVDVTDPAAVAAWFPEVQGVIHLAGPPSVADSFANPHGCVGAHVSGVTSVLAAMESTGCKRLIYISSAEVYGRPRRSPADEAQPLEPRSPYAAAKVAAEALVGAQVRARGMGAVILRPTSVYGPGQSLGGLLGDVFTQLRTQEDVMVRDPRPIRDYLYIEDLVEAVLAASVACAPGELSVFNVGTGRGVSVRALVEAAQLAVGAAGRVGAGLLSDRPCAADIPELVVEVNAARAGLGWLPRTRLAEGLGRTWAWFQAVENLR